MERSFTINLIRYIRTRNVNSFGMYAVSLIKNFYQPPSLPFLRHSACIFSHLVVLLVYGLNANREREEKKTRVRSFVGKSYYFTSTRFSLFATFHSSNLQLECFSLSKKRGVIVALENGSIMYCGSHLYSIAVRRVLFSLRVVKKKKKKKKDTESRVTR